MVKRNDMRAKRSLISATSFSPATCKMLGGVFDTVWSSVIPDLGDPCGETDIARNRLAAIIFDLARDGQLGPHQIAHTARRLFREAQLGPSPNPMTSESRVMSNNILPVQPAFSPQALGLLQLCFDDAWQEVAGNFAAHETDAARWKLASIMLWLASNTELSPTELIEASILLIRENART
jgi:hypothetical protein